MIEGYYFLDDGSGEEPNVVYLKDVEGVMHVGFNAVDGGGVMPVNDINKGSKLTKIYLTPFVGHLRAQVAMHSEPSRWADNEYMRGLTNGLRLALGMICNEAIAPLKEEPKSIIVGAYNH